MNEITSLFKKLSAIATPDEINDDEFELAEFFVVRLTKLIKIIKNLQHKRTERDKRDFVFQR